MNSQIFVVKILRNPNLRHAPAKRPGLQRSRKGRQALPAERKPSRRFSALKRRRFSWKSKRSCLS